VSTTTISGFYTPVLQRIIILVAVIIAVPVVLWTITSFVRTYVGPPQVPTFQRMTALQRPTAWPTRLHRIPRPIRGRSQRRVWHRFRCPHPPADQTQIGKSAFGRAADDHSHGRAARGRSACSNQPIPAQAACPPMAAAPASAGNVSAPSDRTIVWPNPTAPTATSMAAPSAAADAQQPASSNDTSDALPAVPPMRGRCRCRAGGLTSSR